MEKERWEEIKREARVRRTAHARRIARRRRAWLVLGRFAWRAATAITVTLTVIWGLIISAAIGSILFFAIVRAGGPADWPGWVFAASAIGPNLIVQPLLVQRVLRDIPPTDRIGTARTKAPRWDEG
jgi:hypothetical protein